MRCRCVSPARVLGAGIGRGGGGGVAGCFLPAARPGPRIPPEALAPGRLAGPGSRFPANRARAAIAALACTAHAKGPRAPRSRRPLAAVLRLRVVQLCLRAWCDALSEGRALSRRGRWSVRCQWEESTQWRSIMRLMPVTERSNLRAPL